MALNREDKADVKKAMGKALANKVEGVTKDRFQSFYEKRKNSPASKVYDRKLGIGEVKDALRGASHLRTAADVVRSKEWNNVHRAIRASRKN